MQVRTQLMRARWLGWMIGISLMGSGGALSLAQESGGTAVEEAPATTADLPEAKKVHEDYLTAIGGREALSAIQSSKATGEFSIARIKGPLTILKARPNKMLVEIDLGGMGKISQGFDGTTAWDINPGAPPTILEGDAKKERLEQADFDEEMKVDERYKSMTCVAKEEIDGHPCFKVECVLKNNDEKETRFYDAESHFLVRVDSTKKGPLGPMKLQARLSDYREVGKVKVPFMTAVKVLGQEQVIAIKEVEQDAQLAENAFDPPEAVQKLIKDGAKSK